ncbi:hypothetical protein [Streptomyces sp. NPDC008122]|uniref:hypothetical protein n=1 Tax=Streptomyces sp. NPDC008122 TaxID=3364810 RepID=UPI0036E0B978
MRLRQQRVTFPAHEEYMGGHRWPADGVRSATTLPPSEVGGWLAQFAIGLQVHDAFWSIERYEGGAYTLWTYGLDGKSWASVDWEPGETEFLVYQYGPRRLWDETEAAYRWWDGCSRPGFERFGLTVGPRSTVAWLDDESRSVPSAEWLR